MIEDWTHPIGPGMPTFAAHWHRQVSFESLGSVHQVGRATTHIHMGTHSGTHVDAPSHFISGAKSISDFPADVLIGKIFVARVTDREGGKITLENSVFNQINTVDEVKGLVLNFGWSRKWGSGPYYSDQPFLTQEAAEKISRSGVRFVGYDLAMPDNPIEGRQHPKDSRIHKLFLEKEVLLVENLRIPDEAKGYYRSYASTLNLQGVDGSPVRFLVERI